MVNGKIKIFTSSDPDEIERRFNDFFMEPELKVINMEYATSPATVANGYTRRSYSLCVYYTEKV